MHRYAYSFSKVFEDGEVQFLFHKFPDLACVADAERYSAMDAKALHWFIADALVTALQTRMSARIEIPEGDNENLARIDGFVTLTVVQAMKLELYEVYRENCRSITQFAKAIDRHETAARRMLDLRHASAPAELEAALEVFGKRLTHAWEVKLINPLNATTAVLCQFKREDFEAFV